MSAIRTMGRVRGPWARGLWDPTAQPALRFQQHIGHLLGGMSSTNRPSEREWMRSSCRKPNPPAPHAPHRLDHRRAGPAAIKQTLNILLRQSKTRIRGRGCPKYTPTGEPFQFKMIHPQNLRCLTNAQGRTYIMTLRQTSTTPEAKHHGPKEKNNKYR